MRRCPTPRPGLLLQYQRAHDGSIVPVPLFLQRNACFLSLAPALRRVPSMNAAVHAMQPIVLNSHALVMGLFAGVVFAVFIWDRWPIATVSLVILAAIPMGFVLAPYTASDGPVDPMRFFAGLGHPALVAICALMVLGQSLVLTGALEPAARRLSALVSQRPKLALLAVLLGAAGVSGLINDTPVVVLLIPLILAAAARARVAAGAMLLPMN